MGMVSEDLPSSMPAETPQIGDNSQFTADRKAIASSGSPQQPQQATQGAPPAQQPPGGGAPPVQPPPRVPLTQADMAPGGPVFMQPKTQPDPSWRQGLRVMAANPENQILYRLQQRADQGLQYGKPKQGQ